MRNFLTEEIRNVCILGNGNAGKTTVVESMLRFSGAIERRGSVLDGTTVSDYDAEEIKRKISINTSLVSFEFENCKYNILDTPGSYDFIGEALEAIEVADAAVIVVSGKSGVSAGVERAWELCEKRNLPRLFFINKVDDERCNYQAVLEELRDKFGKTVAPFQVPIDNGEKIIGFVDVVRMRARLFQADGPLLDDDIPDYMMDKVEPVRSMIIESVAETDEELMDRYFNGEEFTVDEIKKALRKATDSNEVVPVLCGTALHNKGVGVLLESINSYFPSPDDVEEMYDIGGKPSIYVFKTVADPFVGKLSYFKVMSG